MTYNEFHNLVAMVRDLLNYRLMGNDRFLRTEYRRYGETCAEIIAWSTEGETEFARIGWGVTVSDKLSISYILEKIDETVSHFD